MASRMFSHWLLVLIQGLSAFWALVLRLGKGPGGVCHDILTPAGICACEGQLDPYYCYRDELAFRAGVSSLIIYLLLVALTIQGSLSTLWNARGCQRVAALAAVALIQFVLLLIALCLPSGLFLAVDNVGMFGAAAYRVMQAVLFMDWAYNLNDQLYDNAVQMRRRLVDGSAFTWRLGAMVVASGLLLLGSLIAAIFLCINEPEVTWCVVASVIGSLFLLIVSITNWCEHGSLMTSSVMLAYTVYLCHQVAEIRPDVGDHEDDDVPTTLYGLLVPACSLGYFAISSSPARHLAGRHTSIGDADDAFDSNDFLLRCGVHCLADFYVTSCLAPRVSWLRFNVRAVTVFVCIVVYGWSLVAPKILSARSF